MTPLMATDARAVRGLAIVSKGDSIEREGRNKWLVPSQSKPGARYEVMRYTHGNGSTGKTKWVCSCPDHQGRGVECKHIHAARFTEAAKKQLQLPLPGQMPKRPRARSETFQAALDDEPPSDAITCKFCGSESVVRNGFKSGKQEYRCRASACGRAFVLNEGFARLKAEPKVICLALDLHFKGNSLRQISDTLNQFFGLRVAHMTIYRWMQRYVALINEYASSLEPWVGDKWHADEVFTKFSGKLEYLWHVMDADTRYLLVSKVTKQRDEKEARSVMREAVRLADKTPNEIVTDGLPAYLEGVKRELRGTTHTREIHISKPERYPHNNMVERLNGTVRARQRPARGLKSPKGPLTAGQAAYYNHVRPHMALGGRTPGEAAGVAPKRRADESRWSAIIRHALQEKQGSHA